MANNNMALQDQSAQDSKAGRGDGLEIDLIELLYRLLEKARYLILAALLGALIAGVYTYVFVKPTYKASSKLYVLNTDSLISLSDLQMASNLAGDYTEVFTTYSVYSQVRDTLGLTYSQSEMRNMVNVTNKSGTRILTITATSTDPEEAVRIADAYAEAGRVFIKEVMLGEKTDAQPPSIFELASERGAPRTPSAPNKTQNIILGFVIGLVIAAVIIIVQFIVDDRVRNADMLEKRLGLPVLGMMPATSQDSASADHHTSQRSSRQKGGAKK